MKILIVVENYFPHIGGAEILFQKIAEGLSSQGHKVYVVTSFEKGEQFLEKIGNLTIKRIWVPSFGKRYWFTLFAIFSVCKYAPRVDCIHTTTFNAALPAWIGARLFQKPISITVHEVWQNFWMKIPDMNFIIRFAHKFFENIILHLPYNLYVTDSYHTKLQLQNFLKKQNGNITTIYCGIDYELFSRKKYLLFRNPLRKKLKVNNKKIGLYFGRPGWAKGLEYYVNAIELIVKKIPDFHALIIISQEPRKRYLSILSSIKQLKVRQNVHVLNSVPRAELPKYILASDCVVVPSISEGFGFNVAETCELGVKLVATYAGSIPEVAFGQYLLVKPFSSESIANGIIKILNNNFIKKQTKKSFKWENTIMQYENALNKMIKIQHE